ncbi:twisted gastrulation protein homolog 1 [Anomaloglossus baeobatrachus]|uniref:twisted gastrulation protein homolog 1 n=1 Tax=Anomaloglossus baeobatrachus TaxID=238106 RepID=UPI003F4F96D1
MKLSAFPIPAIAIILGLMWIMPVHCCNKALCASDVSKCLIQELCQCRPTDGNCSCCKECMLCLGTLWDECCDCVERAKKIHKNEWGGKKPNELSQDLRAFIIAKRTDGIGYRRISKLLKIKFCVCFAEHMCTVVYFDDCMSIHQCKVSCESMGASKYRWFHNACCECVGPECIDYGSKTVKCMNCMF